MGNRSIPHKKLIWIAYSVIGIIIVIALYITQLNNYLLFHSVVEIFSVVIAFCVFIIGWNTSKFTNNTLYLNLGVAYFFVACIDVLHTLAYLGMGVFPGAVVNLSVELWIAARYLESASLLGAAFLLGRRVQKGHISFIYFVITSLLISSIFFLDVFPDCYIDGIGLTAFKVLSEYAISGLLLVTAIIYWLKRDKIDSTVIRLLICSVIVTIMAELAFTLYTDVYGFSNMIGHFLKVISFYLIYTGVVRASLTRPYEVLFRDLKLNEQRVIEKSALLEVTLVKLRDTQSDLVSKERLALIGQLSRSIGYELRDPLQAIKNAVYFLKMSPDLKPDVKETLDILETEVGLSDRIITGLLDYASPKPPMLQKILISEIIETALTEIEFPAKIEVSKLLATDLLFIQADPVQISQVFLSICQNAVEAMPEGGSFTVTTEKSKANWIIISFNDTGVGIPEKDLGNLFHPLYTTKAKGVGLGLAISKSILKSHNGIIEVQSEYGKGTTVTVMFPLS